MQQFPSVTNFIGNIDFGFGGGGDFLRLYNPEGILVDAVQYDDNEPWPEEADGEGSTLELINFDSDNSLAESWESSYGNGSPGQLNSVSLFGDLNQDGNQNILDIVILVNLILD